MPQARSGGSRGSSPGSGSRSTRSSGGSRSTRSSGGSRSTRATSGRSGSTSRAGTSSRSRSTGARTRSASGARAGAGPAEARVDAVAQRIRKLNEQIIEAGKEAGESTLTSYEKALKTIAGAIERGPGSSDVEWISNLATAQAKFIRDLTTAWTSAARKMLK